MPSVVGILGLKTKTKTTTDAGRVTFHPRGVCDTQDSKDAALWIHWIRKALYFCYYYYEQKAEDNKYRS